MASQVNRKYSVLWFGHSFTRRKGTLSFWWMDGTLWPSLSLPLSVLILKSHLPPLAGVGGRWLAAWVARMIVATWIAFAKRIYRSKPWMNYILRCHRTSLWLSTRTTQLPHDHHRTSISSQNFRLVSNGRRAERRESPSIPLMIYFALDESQWKNGSGEKNMKGQREYMGGG